jgi:AcrR family transcriptional regulator
MKTAAKLAPAKRRQITEDKLLDALETVLVRDGLRQLSLNAIVAEAGIGKPLLYRYFDNLPGLLAAWVERRGGISGQHLASSQDIPATAADNESFMARLAEQLVASGESLRSQPIMLEMLAEELTANSELSAPFARARRRQSEPFVRAMLSDERYVDPLNRAKIIMLYAAINYLAMRAQRAPAFMGLRLDTRKGWDEAMGMVRTIVLSNNAI